MSEISRQIAALRVKLEDLEQQARDINRQIEELEWQGVKQSSRYIVTLKTQDETEVKYARDMDAAQIMLNKWLEVVERHPGHVIDWFNNLTGFRYRYHAKDWMKIEREYKGVIAITEHDGYVEYKGDGATE